MKSTDRHVGEQVSFHSPLKKEMLSARTAHCTVGLQKRGLVFVITERSEKDVSKTDMVMRCQ